MYTYIFFTVSSLFAVCRSCFFRRVLYLCKELFYLQCFLFVKVSVYPKFDHFSKKLFLESVPKYDCTKAYRFLSLYSLYCLNIHVTSLYVCFYAPTLYLYATVLSCTLLSSTLLYSTPLYSTLLHSTLLYSTLLYSTLLYFILLCISYLCSGQY